MIQYPSIESYTQAPKGKPCYGFYKYDGSNLRWEWAPKRGWYKYGTRHTLFDENTPLFSQAIPIFRSGIGEDIVKTTIEVLGYKPQRIVAFTEFFGPGSFAGFHEQTSKKELKLFDVHTFQKGFIRPYEFLKCFSWKEYAAECVYCGNLNQEIIQDVRERSQIRGGRKLEEGVVFKGDDWAAKVKTLEWLARLKERGLKEEDQG